MQDAFLRFAGKNAIYLVARGQNRRDAAILSAEMREKGGAMFSRDDIRNRVRVR